jgi:hypothetical protein
MKIQRHQGACSARLGLCGVFLCLLGIFYGAGSHAQVPGLWVWHDEHGRKVYSDRAPPSHIPTQSIIQQPAQAPASGAPTGTSAPTGSVVNAGLSPREAVRRDNCLAAQSSLTLLRSHNNWLIEDAHGTRLAMDQGMRRAETARLRQIMRDNCTYAR